MNTRQEIKELFTADIERRTNKLGKLPDDLLHFFDLMREKWGRENGRDFLLQLDPWSDLCLNFWLGRDDTVADVLCLMDETLWQSEYEAAQYVENDAIMFCLDRFAVDITFFVSKSSKCKIIKKKIGTKSVDQFKTYVVCE